MPKLVNNIVIGDTLNIPSFAISFLVDKLRKVGDKVILINGATKAEYTGNDILKEASLVYEALKELSLSTGDKVALCFENRFEYLTCAFAVLGLNACIAPLNMSYTEREMEHTLNLVKPKIVVASRIAYAKLRNIIPKCSFVQRIILLDDSATTGNTISYKSLVAGRGQGNVNGIIPGDCDPNETLAIILCSSGTTGIPKAVALTQKNVIATLYRSCQGFETMIDLNICSIIPWCHGYGCINIIGSVITGNKMVFLPKYEDKLLLQSIEKYKVNLVFCVPPIVIFLAKHPMIDNYDLSSLKVLLCGAAPLSKETEDAAIKRLGLLAIRQGYGLSETTVAVLLSTQEFCKPGSVGVPCINVSAKVVDVESGKTLGPNQRGELCFKGDVVMKGYIDNPIATAQMIDKDGWLHTGDIGYYDDDLVFYVVDRIKELIKYKAFQVPPAELEALLLTHPKIKDAAVVGLPDEECGELPLAFVVKQLNVNLTEKEVVSFIDKQVSSPKRLRGGVRFVTAIPKNITGKILRRELKAMLKKSKL